MWQWSDRWPICCPPLQTNTEQWSAQTAVRRLACGCSTLVAEPPPTPCQTALQRCGSGLTGGQTAALRCSSHMQTTTEKGADISGGGAVAYGHLLPCAARCGEKLKKREYVLTALSAKLSDAVVEVVAVSFTSKPAAAMCRPPCPPCCSRTLS